MLVITDQLQYKIQPLVNPFRYKTQHPLLFCDSAVPITLFSHFLTGYVSNVNLSEQHPGHMFKAITET